MTIKRGEYKMNYDLRDNTNPDKLRCTANHKKCCVVNRWNGTCVCKKCRCCSYCGNPILTDDVDEWKKNGYHDLVILQNHHYSCADTNVIKPLVFQILGNMNDERNGFWKGRMEESK
tara:strand:- start:30 stop:380 length:351 start_codon:yes stop_codon:yes gene_type:complete